MYRFSSTMFLWAVWYKEALQPRAFRFNLFDRSKQTVFIRCCPDEPSPNHYNPSRELIWESPPQKKWMLNNFHFRNQNIYS